MQGQLPLDFDGKQAEAARDEALQRTEDNNKEWAAWARGVILSHLENVCWEVTVDDLRAACQRENRFPTDNRSFGSVLNSMVRAGEIRTAGWTNSEVKTSHGRPIRVFVRNDQ